MKNQDADSASLRHTHPHTGSDCAQTAAISWRTEPETCVELSCLPLLFKACGLSGPSVKGPEHHRLDFSGCIINPALGYVLLKESGSILKETASLDVRENAFCHSGMFPE